MLIRLLALLVLLSPLPLGGEERVRGEIRGQEGARGEIRGQVLGRRGATLAPLPNAMVQAAAGERHFTALTDASGAFSLRGLPPGRWRLQALHVGYEGLEVVVRLPPGGSVSLELELAWHPVSLPPITVRAEPLRPLRDEARPPPLTELGELALRALEGGSGTVEAGLAQVVRSLPGNDPADPRDVLLMRGSAADLKLVLLDGAPVYTPFHMGGLVESFDPGALAGAFLFLGGAPARFDGGLSYILDLRTRTPRRDRIHGMASGDLLTGQALLEGPLSPSTGFLVGSRRIHGLGTPLLGRSGFPYGYGDLLGRLEWEGTGGEGAFLTGFWNREAVRLDLSPLGPEPGGEDALWGNRALAAGLRGSLGGASGELRLAASRYHSELPLGDSLPLFARGETGRVRLTADFSLPWGEGALRFGGSVDHLTWEFEAEGPGGGAGSAPARVELEGTTGGGYLEGSRPLTPSFTLRGGLRADAFSPERRVRLAPRVALTWLLAEEALLTLAAGRYHQLSPLSSGEIGQTLAGLGGPAGSPLPPPRVAVASATHLVVSLDQILTPGVRLGLEGFVKEFAGLSESPGWRLNASGVDLRVAREGSRTAGWLGYTLTWFWTSTGVFSQDGSRFSGRHLLSAGLTARLTERTGLRLRVGYGDGLPYTSIPILRAEASEAIAGVPTVQALRFQGDRVLNQAPELTAGPEEGFLRVEAELHGRWSSTLGGREVTLRPYLRVLNALNRRDALFYHFDPWRSPRPSPLAELPLLPLAGVEVRF